MKKAYVLGTVGALALAGMGFAAAGGGAGSLSGSAVRLPAGAGKAPDAAINATPAAAEGDIIADAWICTFKAGAVGRGNERAEAARAAAAGGGQLGHVYDVALQGFSVHASAQGLAQMKARNPNIGTCEADRIARIPAPIMIAAKPGGGGTQPAQTRPYGITRVGGGLSGATGTAWVIDTGIDLTHPDLNVDLARSANFVSRETSPQDLNGHGTHVSGTIAAKDNTIGVIGVAAGAKLVAVRVLDRRGSGAYSDVIAGVNYVAANGAAGDVANMSLGGPVSDLLDQAVINASAKVRFALAAGNETDDANNHSPARAEGPNIYTISAINSTDTFASFSNYGNPPVDYAEPGVSINSTWLNGGYNTISGTSMASPHMAGLLLLGSIRSGGTAKSDPDGKPDTIGVH
jgi:subtilisin family serine protease